MKYVLTLILLMTGAAFAQNLSPEEQKQLLIDVKELKNKVNKLEAEKSPKGLKTIDYKGGTTEASTNAAAPSKSTTPSLTPEQTQEFMQVLQKAKAQQEAQNKALQELENEE
jgi:hypothetical protein